MTVPTRTTTTRESHHETLRPDRSMLTIKRFSKTDAAYIAGILDGEGYIALSRKTDSTTRSGYCYRPSVAVTNTKHDLLKWLQRKTGLGNVRVMKKRNAKHKQAWRWELWSQQARQVLITVHRYLVIKRKQSALLMYFATEHGVRNRQGKMGLSAHQQRDQLRVYKALVKLNRRGV